MISEYFCSLCWVPPYSNPILIFGFLFLVYIVDSLVICFYIVKEPHHLFWLLVVYNSKYYSTWNKMHLESLKLLLYLEKILYPLLKNLDTLQSWVDEWSWDDAKSFWKEFAFQMQISLLSLSLELSTVVYYD